MDATESIPEDGSKPQNGNGKNGAEKGKVKGWIKGLLTKNEEQSLKNELEEIIQEHEEDGNLASSENTILRNVLKFDELRVTNVMTQRLYICAVQADISLEELKKYVSENEHTRIPVFDKNLDDVVGFIHIKDLMRYWVEPKKFKLHEILREILYVPPSMKINNLLVKMQAERTHMAVVVDEYGGTTGLVTIEDLMEEIVGEIEDEHDEENQEECIRLDDSNYEVLARVEIKKLEEILNIKIPKNADHDYETIGGLIFSILGKIPRIGESVKLENGLLFKVIDADKRRIKKVKITATAPIATGDDPGI